MTSLPDAAQALLDAWDTRSGITVTPDGFEFAIDALRAALAAASPDDEFETFMKGHDGLLDPIPGADESDNPMVRQAAATPPAPTDDETLPVDALLARLEENTLGVTRQDIADAAATIRRLTDKPDPDPAVITGDDLYRHLHRHHPVDKTCPGCDQPISGEGITHLAYTFELCTCDRADYEHLTERIWHLRCQSDAAIDAEAVVLLRDALHLLGRYQKYQHLANRIDTFLAQRQP